MSTKKQIFEDKQVETLPNKDLPAKIQAIKGGQNPRKNGKELAEEPQRMEHTGCHHGRFRTGIRATAAMLHKNIEVLRSPMQP
jgi:hypothetical protein